MTPFARIRETAAARHGGAAALTKLLPEAKKPAALTRFADDRYFSQMSFRVFSAGLKHSMVEAKWPAFEEAFLGFAPKRVRGFSDDDLQDLMKDARLIRHWGKIKATRENAAVLQNIADEHGSFGRWLAAWPGTDIVGLWAEIGSRFAQMGGLSSPYFLRMVGKDTFMLSRDVVNALDVYGAYSGPPKGKKAQAAIQAAFNVWAEESGQSLCQISRTLALSVD